MAPDTAPDGDQDRVTDSAAEIAPVTLRFMQGCRDCMVIVQRQPQGRPKREARSA